MEKRHNYVRKVAEVAVQMFITNDKPNIAGLVLAIIIKALCMNYLYRCKKLKKNFASWKMQIISPQDLDLSF
jgi:hypothetical protein